MRRDQVLREQRGMIGVGSATRNKTFKTHRGLTSQQAVAIRGKVEEDMSAIDLPVMETAAQREVHVVCHSLTVGRSRRDRPLPSIAGAERHCGNKIVAAGFDIGETDRIVAARLCADRAKVDNIVAVKGLHRFHLSKVGVPPASGTPHAFNRRR
ncbi:MAG: hypothetical protein H2055_07630 [Sphingopyxis sp.]|nr:hypothetical protein [Sphingopyxis sp.]